MYGGHAVGIVMHITIGGTSVIVDYITYQFLQPTGTGPTSSEYTDT